MKLYESGEYRASKNWPYAVSAGCVVYRQADSGTQVLLLFRRQPDADNDPNLQHSNQYHLPKGHVDLNELLSDAALRETREESGVDVVIESYAGPLFWSLIHPKHQIHVQKTVHYFIARWQKDLPEMDNEHDGKEWVDIDEAETLLGAPNPKGEDEIIRRLKDFLELTK